MIRTGFVKDKKGDKLSVCFERPSSCAGCKGCAKAFIGKSELLTVFGEAEIGDIVDVQMPENRVFQAALFAYALPLCVMIAGLVAGTMLKLSDAVTFAVALVGLGVGFALSRLAENYLSKRNNWRPAIIEVRKDAACTAEERK